MAQRGIGVLLLLALAACAGPPAPKDSFFRLEVAAPAARFERPLLPGVVEVDRLEADGVIGDRALAYATRTGGALERYRYDMWSEAPGIMLRDVLADALRGAGAAERVVTPDLRVPADWSLRGKIRRFEQLVDANKAMVVVQLAVVSARDGTLVLQQSYVAEIPIGGAGAEAVAAAIGRGASEVVARFLADLGQVRLPESRR